VKDKAAVVVSEGQVEGEGGGKLVWAGKRTERMGRVWWRGGYGTMLWRKDQER